MSIILAALIIISFCLLGIKFWKKSRILSLLLFLPAVFALMLVGYGVYNTWYHTTPNSLKLSVYRCMGKTAGYL